MESKIRELGLSVFVEVETVYTIPTGKVEQFKKIFKFYNIDTLNQYHKEKECFITVLSFYFPDRYALNNEDMKNIKKKISEILK